MYTIACWNADTTQWEKEVIRPRGSLAYQHFHMSNLIFFSSFSCHANIVETASNFTDQLRCWRFVWHFNKLFIVSCQRTGCWLENTSSTCRANVPFADCSPPPLAWGPDARVLSRSWMLLGSRCSAAQHSGLSGWRGPTANGDRGTDGPGNPLPSFWHNTHTHSPLHVHLIPKVGRTGRTIGSSPFPPYPPSLSSSLSLSSATRPFLATGTVRRYSLGLFFVVCTV